jgi:uncharacterized protein DUF4255
MSNTLAIATATATLALEILQKAVETAVPGASVTTGRPDSTGSNSGKTHVNLYLFQVTPNTAWRNNDLPTRTSDGQLIQKPRVAIDLHYLLTFYGDEALFEPQRMLGSVVLAIHAKPMLTRKMITNTIGNSQYPFLAESNLADEVELIKFTPLPLSLEELSKLWSVFFQTQYTLSIAYQGTVVLIESEDAPRSSLPVKEPMVYTIPFRHPHIDRVYPDTGIDQLINAKSMLVIEGRQLRGDVTQVRIAGGDPLTPTSVTDTTLTLQLASLPAGTLQAGVEGLQVVQSLLLGKPPQPHTGFESNVTPFIVHPNILSASAPSSTQVDVKCDVTIGKKQRVLLLLNENVTDKPAAYSFSVEPRAADSDTLTIAIKDVKAGNYFVRVQVDGAESPLDLDPASQTFGPTMVIP